MCYDISEGHGAGAYTDINFKGAQFGGGGEGGRRGLNLANL